MFFNIRFILLPVVFLCLFISSCSNSDEEKEAGIIDRHNEKVTAKAIDYIKSPIDQAKLAKEAQEKHNRMVEESIKPQE